MVPPLVPFLIFFINIIDRINRIMIRILITCLLLSLAGMGACEASATTISIADVTVEPGDAITIPIMISDLTDYGTGTIEIEYDPAAVHVTDVASGHESDVAGYNIDNTLGFTQISASNSYGVSGDIIFANVTFEATGDSSTPLNLTVTLLGDILYNEIPATVSDGSIEVPDATTTLSQTIADQGTDATSTTPVETPSSEGAAGENASMQTPEEISVDDCEVDCTAPTTRPTSGSSVPGFEAAFIIIGLISAFMICKTR